ncbi:flagellar assembly protein FliH [Pseudomonas chlororaphis subsp. aurantiaca]|uniref:flagellar assembly protein FliH n=1 Tax=Pseudomonas chlororaphis TaxID=587753 RepID=UPI0027DAD623|nr:flagellar assembly protein FliH [Pseudomonas chlororaphis]WMI97622.1 flagellar assembly protein FliH [Pseudomonas chlororaphis subsp. aurantiaca]
MSIKVVKGKSRDWRPYRFPPLPDLQAPELSSDPIALQRAIADGFQEGNEKGYLEGLAQGREQGQQQGFDCGLEQGLQEGRAQGQLDGRQSFDQASAPLEAVNQQLRRFMAELELKRRQELLALVKKVSEQVIRCELTLNPTQLLTLAEEALASMPLGADEVHIQLHPQEFARIKDLAPDRAQAWRLVADETLALGECRIVSQHEEVDVGCQQRLDACVATLSDHLHLHED